MRDQIVILAAGKGTRMGGAVPKVLAMLKNKPLILYVLEEIEKINQLAKPIIVVGYKSEKVKAVVGEDFIYSIQDKQLGTAHALLAAKHKVIGENILVLYGDMPLVKSSTLKKLLTMHHAAHTNISMLTTIVPNFEGIYKSLNHSGRIERQNGKLTKIVEYKDASAKQKEILELNAGVYVFNAKWLWENIERIKNTNAQAEYYLTDIVEIAIAAGEKVKDMQADGEEIVGVNSPEDLKLVEKLVK